MRVHAFRFKISLNKLDIDSISVSGNDIPLSNSCRNLGVMFYSQMSMSKQTTIICKSVRYQLRNIGFIRKYLTRSATEKLVHSLISSRLDFGNGLLYNLPNSQIGQLQKLQNAAARVVGVVSLSSKRSHNTPILKTLHWLPVKERIIFKILLFVYYIVNGTAPDYNKSSLWLYQPTRTLRSSNSGLLQIPLSKKSWGNELLLMPDQPCGIHFHRSWRTQILQHPLSLIWLFEDRYSFFMVYMYIRFSCHVCHLFCLCCKAPWALNQNGYGAI